MFDNPTDNHTDIEVPLYYKLRFTKLKMSILSSYVLDLDLAIIRKSARPSPWWCYAICRDIDDWKIR